MTSLAARLIVEADYRIDQFLIVTFTVAAAGELRSRFWSTLNDARQALGSGSAASSAQACSLIDHWQRGGQSDDGAKTRLAAAIREFDRAHITTIHGFCQRALIEFALYARTPFRFDVSGNDVVGVAAAARDFWRRSMTNEDPWLLRCAEDGSFRPDEDTASWAGRQTDRAERHPRRRRRWRVGEPAPRLAERRPKGGSGLAGARGTRSVRSGRPRRRLHLEEGPEGRRNRRSCQSGTRPRRRRAPDSHAQPSRVLRPQDARRQSVQEDTATAFAAAHRPGAARRRGKGLRVRLGRPQEEATCFETRQPRSTIRPGRTARSPSTACCSNSTTLSRPEEAKSWPNGSAGATRSP